MHRDFSRWVFAIVLALAAAGVGYFVARYVVGDWNATKEMPGITATSTLEEQEEEITPSETGGDVTLDLSTELARQYQTILSRELNLPANFAGHYRIALVGCGSGCGYHILLDKNTGKVYPTPANEDLMLYSSVGFSVSSSDFTLFYTDGKTKVYGWDGTAFVRK